jgi:succinoglycan biosynthesis transport protein ExoP
VDTGTRVRIATLADFWSAMTRRKWIVLPAIILLPVAAILYSFHQQRLYAASAQVLLSSQDLAATLTGTQPLSAASQPDRIAQTQAYVARVSSVARQALQQTSDIGLSPQGLLASSTVTAATGADILTFTVTNQSGIIAERLVDAYANAYVAYRRQLDIASIERALSGVNTRLDQLSRGGDQKTSLYNSLVDRQQTLQTMAALGTSNAAVVEQASGFTQTQPKTVRNAIVGLLLGVILGVGLGLLRESLDSKVRGAEEIAIRLGDRPLLALLATPRRSHSGKELVMLHDSRGGQAEAFRMLRTNLELSTLDKPTRTLLVSSALAEEGKSTTAANLALALAMAGRHVILVDLDLRRPSVHRLFDLHGPGVTDVALGRVSLEAGLIDTPLTLREPNASGDGGRPDGSFGQGGGSLEVLPSGTIPPNPGEFVSTEALERILQEMRDRADIVIIDSPPILVVGDALALSPRVDGILVVARLNVVSQHTLADLRRQLATTGTRVVGVVVTGAATEAHYDYAYSSRVPSDRTGV